MPLVQGPTVVFGDECPVLRGHSAIERVLADVANCPANVVGMVQEYLPSRLGPDWMIRRPETGRAKPQAGGLLKILDHLLSFVPVFADQQMNVIRHDCAGVTGVPIFAHRLGECVGDCANVGR